MADTSPSVVVDLAEHVIGIEIIRNIIFDFLPLQDLLSCSVVSRAWNQAARSFIRNSRVCCIKIRGGQPCKNLQSVSTLLEKSSSPVPFNGLSLNVSKQSHTGPCEISWDNLQQACRALFSKLELKYLTVKTKALNTCVNCPAVKFIVKLLLQKSRQLHQLELADLSTFFEMVPWHLRDPQQQPAFRNLRTLNTTNFIPILTGMKFFPLLFKEAPNLEIMLGTLQPISLLYFPHQKLNIIKNFCIGPPFEEDMIQICEKIASSSQKLKLERLTVDVLGSELADEQFYDVEEAEMMLQVLNRILKNTAASLRFFELELRLLLHRNFKLPELKNVETLKLKWDDGLHYDDQIPLPMLLRTFDLATRFPQLRRVEFLGEFLVDKRTVIELLRRSEYRVNAPVTGVTELLVQIKFPGVLNILADLFPSVRNLEVVFWDLDDEGLIQLWTSWPKLVGLTVKEARPDDDYEYESREPMPEFRGYYDAVFSGIDQEECRLLRRMEAKDLRGLQLARRRPSLLDLTELKGLHLSFAGTALSHLTEVLTLERIPNVVVKHEVKKAFTYFSDSSFGSSAEFGTSSDCFSGSEDLDESQCDFWGETSV